MTPAQQQARIVDRIARVRLANDRLIQQAAEKRVEEEALGVSREPKKPRPGNRKWS